MGKNQKFAIANAVTMSGKYPAGMDWNSFYENGPVNSKVDQLLESGLKHNPDGTAIDFLGRKISYRELDSMVKKAAAGLQKSGVCKGDKVGLFMPNTPYYPVMFMALLSIGATVVNYSPMYSEAELAAQIEDSDTDIMVTLNLKDFFGKCEALHEKGNLKKIVKCNLEKMLPKTKARLFRLFKSSEIAKPENPESYIDFSELVNNDGSFTKPDFDPDHVAVLQYTGGTTGTPKGAMLTHFNLAANAHQISLFFSKNEQTPEDAITIQPGKEKFLATLPYFHVYGMMTAMLSPLHSGSEIIMLPNPRDINTTLKTIDTKKPTLTPLVPRLVQALDESPKNAWQAFKADRKSGFLRRCFNAFAKYPVLRSFNLGSIKGVVSGGAALPPATLQSFENMVGRENIILQGYGLSETSPFAASNPGHGKNKPCSVGLPCPGTEIKIVDPNDPETLRPIGEMGEICIRGPQVFKGYYGKPEETAQTLTEGGWFHTGDLGHLDEDMYIHITDRKKRMIIVNGENVYPNQIENCVTRHPSIAECVVIGLPDERSGEAAKIFVRFRDAAACKSEAEFREFLEANLSRAEVPKYCEFVEEELPKTSVGKPDWKTLQDSERAKLGQGLAL
jgi:long-chain acyl-CoA synthetase